MGAFHGTLQTTEISRQRRKWHEMSPYVTVDAESEIDEGLPPTRPRRSPVKVAVSDGAAVANRSARSRAMSITRATTVSTGSAANILGRVGWI